MLRKFRSLFIRTEQRDMLVKGAYKYIFLLYYIHVEYDDM